MRRTQEDVTALVMAAQYGNSDAVRVLIERGADVETRSEVSSDAAADAVAEPGCLASRKIQRPVVVLWDGHASARAA